MTPKTFLVILITLLIAAIVAFGVWFFFFNGQTVLIPNTADTGTGFEPLNRPSNGTGQTNTGNTTGTSTTNTTAATQKIPTLRLLSNTPVGGFGAITSGTTTIARWIDRGRGNVYEAKSNTLDITTLSNIVLPRVYESSWNKDVTTFIGSVLEDNSETASFIYAELKARPTATSTATTTTQSGLTPFELRGKNLPSNTAAYAISPDKTRVFVLTKSEKGSIGYTANMDGTKMTQIFTTPLTQLNVEWPSDSAIAITTKGTADRSGFMYFVNPKTGVWKKILGPLNGLSTRVSHDAKYVLLSVTGRSEDVVTGLYDVANSKAIDMAVSTIADKCVWGNFYKEMVYCGVPFQLNTGAYPDDWYKGTLSTVDKMWQVNAITGETKLVGQILGQAGRVIDAFNLGLDDKDNFLFFMNKNDLSLWSLDLVGSK